MHKLIGLKLNAKSYVLSQLRICMKIKMNQKLSVGDSMHYLIWFSLSEMEGEIL